VCAFAPGARSKKTWLIGYLVEVVAGQGLGFAARKVSSDGETTSGALITSREARSLLLASTADVCVESGVAAFFLLKSFSIAFI